VISVVVPVRNDPDHLRACLESLAATRGPVDREVIVVDDASTDGSAAVAQSLGSRVIRLDKRAGPAAARNLGAEAARGEIIFFVDADVCVHPETVAQVASAFAADPGIDALFGSYDRQPGEPNFLSQYKNLFHHFVHQQGSAEAATFWSGCGAIKRSVFLEMGGFDTSYARPCIEDIELGARLRRAGRRVVLRKDIQARHLKRWTLPGIVRSDVWDRGVPWTELILREGSLPDDLNLRLAQRLSAVMAYLSAAAVLAAPWRLFGLGPVAWLGLAGILLLAVIAVNWRFYAFFTRERGLLFAARVVPLHVLYYLYSGLALAIGAARHVWKTKVRPSSKMKVAPGAPAP
jgi:glycosyltransferase involved in cell wall biosynthesis